MALQQENKELYLQLKSILDTVLEKTNRYTDCEWREQLKTLSDDLEAVEKATFKVGVIGGINHSHKSGQSSFINALIGENILPVNDFPCTQVNCEVKYGPNKKAVAHFNRICKNDLLDNEYIPDDVLEYIQKYMKGVQYEDDSVAIPPLEVSLEQVSKYITLPTDELFIDCHHDVEEFICKSDELRKLFDNLYDKVEIFCPFDILKEGWLFGDFIPFACGSYELTTKVIKNIQESDAAIFLFDASHPCTSTERDDIELLRSYGFKDLVFVANRIDLVGERETVRMFIEVQATPYSSNKHVYAVSAREALEARQTGDEELLNKSGLPTLKGFLEEVKGNKEKERLKIIVDSLIEVMAKYVLPVVESDYRKVMMEGYDESKAAELQSVHYEIWKAVYGIRNLVKKIDGC